MAEINTNEWGEFNVEDLFTIVSISKKLTKKNLCEEGKVPVYSSTTINNGIEGYSKENPTFIVNEENSLYLVFGDHTKSMNLATESFCVMDNVKVLIPKYKSIRINQFICTIWRKQIPDLGYARHWGIARNILIKLPINHEGKLDLKYIDNYMNLLEDKVNKSLETLEKTKCSLKKCNIINWKKFHLYDIFDIDAGTKLDRIAMKFDNPTINFVGRSGINNGVTTCVEEVKGIKPYKAGNLTLALGGAYIGSCFVQDKDFYTSQNVVVLIPKKDMSFNTKQFICSMIFKEGNTRYKAFIDELNRHIKTDFTIKLPINNFGDIDYEYMDKFMEDIKKNILNRIKVLGNI